MKKIISHISFFMLAGFAILSSIAIVSLSFINKQQLIATFERLDPAINAIVGPNPVTEVIADGYTFTEGPLWIEEKKMLLFSDIPGNRILKWTKEKGAEEYLRPSGYTGTAQRRDSGLGSNGLAINSKGQLVICQHGDRRVVLMNAPLDAPRPDFITLADNYEGKKLDSPNDAVFHSNGDLYINDPPYGLPGNFRDPGKAAPYQGIYKLSGGKLTLLTDTVTRPNGIAFFPGEKSLIVANSDPAKPNWYIYDVTSQGLLANGRIFYSVKGVPGNGLPDGLKIDRQGNVFASGPGGIWIFNKSGKLLGKIILSSGLISNCELADGDKILYASSEKRMLKISLK